MGEFLANISRLNNVPHLVITANISLIVAPYSRTLKAYWYQAITSQMNTGAHYSTAIKTILNIKTYHLFKDKSMKICIWIL